MTIVARLHSYGGVFMAVASMLGRFLLLGLIGTVVAVATPLTYTFSISPPGGAIAGPAGSNIGWGYSITNQDPTDWLVTTNFQAGLFQNGTTSALFDFPILSPGSTVTVPFDPI